LRKRLKERRKERNLQKSPKRRKENRKRQRKREKQMTGQGGRTYSNLSPKARPSLILPYSHHHMNAGSRNTENRGKGLINDFFRSLSGKVPIALPCRGYAFDRKGSS
jgi:hypothetical protein